MKEPKAAYDWLKFINAESESDLMALEQSTSTGEIKTGISKLRDMSSDETIRREAYYTEKRLHDKASFLRAAEQTGFSQGEASLRKKSITKMRENGFTEEQIQAIFGK